jgi:hypothetical protein
MDMNIARISAPLGRRLGTLSLGVNHGVCAPHDRFIASADLLMIGGMPTIAA